MADHECARDVTHRWSYGAAALFVIGVMAIAATIMWSQMMAYRQIKLDMLNISNEWQHRAVNFETHVNQRLDRLPPDSLVQAAALALEISLSQEERLDRLEKLIGRAGDIGDEP